MKLEIQLHFNGDCREAFEFYSKVLGGTIDTLLSYQDLKIAEQVPPEYSNKIARARMSAGDLVIAGEDLIRGYERPTGFKVFLQLNSEKTAKNIFRQLAEDGEIVLPIQSTFWSASYGIVRDKFDIPWELNCSTSSIKAK
jgi:PhnB protein